MRAQRIVHPCAERTDGQLGWIRDREGMGGSRGAKLARTLDRELDGSVQLAVGLALAHQSLVTAQLPSQGRQVRAQALGKARLEHR